jgi:hypothetical protein
MTRSAKIESMRGMPAKPLATQGIAAARLVGSRLRHSALWSNALVIMLILLGPAIEDSATGKDVFEPSTRICLFVGVALYASGTVWALERWRASRSEAFFKRGRI